MLCFFSEKVILPRHLIKIKEEIYNASDHTYLGISMHPVTGLVLHTGPYTVRAFMMAVVGNL